ncbi:MAG: M48 family metallopeptidase [Candidatus Acidiferrales bacterium]|jgi:Zn-dependent protease with chaperone function
MKRLALVLTALAFGLPLALCSSPLFAGDRVPNGLSFAAQQAPASTTSSQSAPSAAPAQEAQQKVTAYTLPPDRYKQARDRSRILFRFAIISFVYGVVVLWLILRWKIAPKYRTWAESASSKRFLQALIFAPLLILTIDTLELPTGIYDNWVERKYGLSVQGWGSWTWDWAKGELISVILGIVLISILYAVIRRSPRRWWFYFWLVSLPILLFVFFLQPLIIDPLFHKFTPLAQKDPALVVSLEQMVQRAGGNIPPERMFWMGASEKSTALDAYVTGFGASKRIVVWDTTIAKMQTPQIVYVTGHEMGHYMLQHIPKLIAFSAVVFLIFFYLGYRCVGWVLARWGGKWGVRGVDDWASLPALLLLISIFGFLANPVTNAFSRHYEHQADQYGLEVTHGLTPDSGQVAAQSFQILGETDLDDPEPNPVDVFLFYTHPPIPDRIHFALTYDPWANGGTGEFVH